MEVYERIKARRKDLGLSADDVAAALNVSRATVYRYESAEIEKLPTQIIVPLAQVLRCSPAWLMGWEDEAPPAADCSNLGKIIKQYREEHGLSLRDFAKISGVSNSYLSMLETGRQPSSGRPIVPTLTKINQIAAAMGVSPDDLVLSISLPAAVGLSLSPLEEQIIRRFRVLPDGERNMLLRSLGLEEKGAGASDTQNAG